MERNNWRRVLIVLAVVLGAACYLWYTVDISDVLTVIASTSLPLYLLGVLSFYITIPLRTKRWQHLLNDIDISTRFSQMNGIIFLSLYFNTILPAKSGDLYRGYKTATRNNESASATMATIVVERVFDIIVLLTLLVVVSFSTFQRLVADGSRYLPPILFGTGVLFLLAYVVSTRDHPRIDWLKNQLMEFRRGLRCIRSVRTLVSFLSITAILWGVNVVRVALLARSITVGIGLIEVALIAVIITLLTGLPYTPAGIGVVEGITTATLVGIGVSSSTGFALVVLDRSITVVSVIVFGSIYLVFQTGSLNPWAVKADVDREME